MNIFFKSINESLESILLSNSNLPDNKYQNNLSGEILGYFIDLSNKDSISILFMNYTPGYGKVPCLRTPAGNEFHLRDIYEDTKLESLDITKEFLKKVAIEYHREHTVIYIDEKEKDRQLQPYQKAYINNNRIELKSIE